MRKIFVGRNAGWRFGIFIVGTWIVAQDVGRVITHLPGCKYNEKNVGASDRVLG